MKILYLITVVFALAIGSDAFSQTYLYKRVAIVKKGNRKTVNDDAHYLTFNKKGCYESDANGLSQGGELIRFRKKENNIHCYYGNSSFGMAHYYFSNDFSRLNIRLDDNITYVYQRELSGKTTASKRVARSNNSNEDRTYVTPPPVIYNGNISVGSGTSGNSSSRSSSIYQTCKYCKGTGVCTRCKGKCGDWRFIDTYTGDGTKAWINCSSCNGNGRCSICLGTGKL